jgi:hypothetical protein
MSAALVRYDAMRTAITAAHSVDEVKDIRDKAAALELYARQANDMELERLVRDIRIRAERRAGELLRDMPRATGGQPYQSRATTGSEPPVKTIADLGISRDQSSCWQKLAAVPDEEFEAGMANPVALPSAAIIIAAHEARNRPQAPPSKPVDARALWLWGILLDFERDGILRADPEALFGTMLDHMRETTRELAPLVAAWIGRIPQ